MKDFILINKKTNELFNENNNIVLLTFDQGYYMQALNLMLTVKKFNEKVSFICICSEISKEIESELFNKQYKLGLCVYEYRANFTLNSKRWKDITCFRVFAPWLIDNENIKEVLYLDADMLCKGDLNPVFNIKDYLIVMCNEISGNVLLRERSNEGLNIYCNAGLTKINLSLFRKEYTYEEISKLFFRNLDILKCLDQDFLNYFFDEKKIKKINGCIYNFQPYEYFGSYYYDSLKENCRIIHFASYRPWDRENNRKEYFDLYLKYSLYQPLINIVKHEKKRAKQIALLNMLKLKRKKRK